MITLHLIEKAGMTWLAEYHAASGAVAETRTHWNEEDGPQTFVVMDEDGTVEHHRCHYRLDEAGCYEGCDVTEVVA